MKSRGGLTDLRLDPLVTTWWSWKIKNWVWAGRGKN